LELSSEGISELRFFVYYPALTVLAVVFSSFRLSLAMTTTVAVIYVVICLVLGDGLDVDAGKERVLVARVATLYVMVLGLNFITRFKRGRLQAAVSREGNCDGIVLSSQRRFTTRLRRRPT
jgi:hypothetical protein